MMPTFTPCSAETVAAWDKELRPRCQARPAPSSPTPLHPTVFEVLRRAWIQKQALRDWIERSHIERHRCALVLNLLDEQIAAIDAELNKNTDWHSIKWNLEATAAAQRAAVAERVKGTSYHPSRKE